MEVSERTPIWKYPLQSHSQRQCSLARQSQAFFFEAIPFTIFQPQQSPDCPIVHFPFAPACWFPRVVLWVPRPAICKLQIDTPSLPGTGFVVDWISPWACRFLAVQIPATVRSWLASTISPLSSMLSAIFPVDLPWVLWRACPCS